jgi:hypothetical protein
MRVLCVTAMVVAFLFAAPAESFTSDVTESTTPTAHTPTASSGTSSEHEKAAAKGLVDLLQGSSFHKRIGIASEKNALESTIGAGFQVYTITPRRFKDIGSNSLSDLAVPTNLREFIVMNQGQAKAIIRVDVTDGGWKAVSIGAAGLAGELLRTIDAWPVSSGYSLRLIRVYQATCEFIEVSKGTAVVGIVPLISTRAALGLDTNTFDPAVVYDEKSVVAQIRAIVSANSVSPEEAHP